VEVENNSTVHGVVIADSIYKTNVWVIDHWLEDYKNGQGNIIYDESVTVSLGTGGTSAFGDSTWTTGG
jgi:hypothetical protein